ncbi:MAG: DUF2341 domain-containing protein, partial [Kiritimatiellae bacterium]|nr:DUF2341 domain-containing protein [Kiritimatiellia bacterium]
MKQPYTVNIRAIVVSAVLALCGVQALAAHTEVTAAPRLPYLRGMGFDGYYEGRNRSWMTQQGVYSGLVAKGFDHVRLPVDFRDYATYDSNTGVATLKETTTSSSWWSSTAGPGFSTFDTVINNAINAGLYITLDFHGWFNIDVTNQAQRAQFKALWKAVAERYKDYPNQLNFELANEPRAPVGHSSHLNSLQKETVAIIRETNPTRLILYAVPDANQPWALTQCANPPKTSWVSLPANDNNIALVIHSYNPGYFTHQGEGWNAGSSTTNVPFSAKYRRELQQDLDWCKAYMDLTGNKIDLNEFNASHAIATHSDVTDYLSMVTRFCESNKVPWAPWIYYANGSGFDCFSGYGANASMIDYIEAGLFPDLKTTDKFSTGDYPHRVEIAFSGYTGSSALANFPVLVKLSESLTGFHYSDFTRADGFDLCFTDANGNLIPHEIDTWNPSGVSTVWVKVLSLTSSTKIVARYGCAKPIVPKVESVWDSDYVAVWHMGEPKLPLADSSNVSRDLTAADGSGIGYGVAGVAGKSVDFGSAGGARGLFADDHANLDGHAKLTVEAWTYQKAHGTNAGIVSKRKSAGSQMSYYMFDNGSGTTMSYSTNGSASVSSGVYPQPVMGRWNHQAYSLDSTQASSNSKGYLNGALTATKSVACDGGIFAGTGELCIGNLQSGNAANFPGRIDEVRVSKCVRSADWVKASYDTVANASFATYAVDGVASSAAPEEQGANLVPDDIIEYNALDMDAFAKKVTVTFSGYSGSALQDFPVLVKLSTAINGFSYGDFQKANGGDLRFADSTGTLLPHEIDTWNTNGVSTIWVKVPSLSANGTITACYGCANPPAVAAKDVWDDDYVGVWHLGEAALPLVESSKTSTDFTTSKGSGIGYAASGIVGGSVDFGASGNSRALLANDHAALDGFTKCTFEAWTYIDASLRGYKGGAQTNDLNKGLLAKRNSYSSECSYYLFDTGSATQFYVCQDGTSPASASSKVAAPSGAWTHQVYTFDGTSSSSNVEGWKNGVSAGKTTQAKTSIYAGSANLCLGNFQSGDARNFPGKIDEVRISKTVRSADWIKATHDTIANANFATYEVQDNAVQPPEPQPAFAHEVDVTFSGYSGGSALADFPVLVRLSPNIIGFSYADFSLPNGGDLRFYDESGNMLSHEIDTWNTNGVSTVWVKVLTLTAATKITAKYGSTDMLPAVSAKDVWDDDYVGVWHLGESALPMKESSETSSDFTSSYGTTIGYAADGVVGGSVDFPAGGLT